MKTAPHCALLLFCLVFIQTNFFGAHLAIAQSDVPGSFVYGGQSSMVLLPLWTKVEKSYLSQTGRQVTETTWREPAGGLVAVWYVEHFADSSVIEYRWVFETALLVKP